MKLNIKGLSYIIIIFIILASFAFADTPNILILGIPKASTPDQPLYLAENILKMEFKKHGFNLIELSAEELKVLKGMDLSNNKDMANFGKDKKADYLILFKVSLKDMGRVMNTPVHSFHSNIKLRMIESQTGELITFLTKSASAGHLNPVIGTQKAVRKASLKAARNIVAAFPQRPMMQAGIGREPSSSASPIPQKERLVSFIDKGNKFAVVIGIGEYKDSSIPSLKYTTADARAIYNFLTDPRRGGFPRENVKLLLDKDATLVNIKSSLGTYLAKSALKDDLIFIYYAGHGAIEDDFSKTEPDGYAKYFVPFDANSKDLYATALAMSEIQTIFSRLASEKLVLVIDACYSGSPVGRGFSFLEGRRDLSISNRYIETLSQGRGRVVITASDANEPSIESDDLKHGIFTYYLLEAFGGKADANQDSYISIKEAYEYTYEKVARSSQRVQNPVWRGTLQGDIVLGKKIRD